MCKIKDQINIRDLTGALNQYFSQPIKFQISKGMLEAVVPVEHVRGLWYLLQAPDNHFQHIQEMKSASGQASLVHVLDLESCKNQFRWCYIISMRWMEHDGQPQARVHCQRF